MHGKYTGHYLQNQYVYITMNCPDTLDWEACLWSRGGHAWIVSGYGHVNKITSPPTLHPHHNDVEKTKVRFHIIRHIVKNYVKYSYHIPNLNVILTFLTPR